MKCSHSESRALSRLLLREKGDRGAVDEELAQVPTNGRPYDIFSVIAQQEPLPAFFAGRRRKESYQRNAKRKRGLFEKSPLLTPAKTFRRLLPECLACAPKAARQPVSPAAGGAPNRLWKPRRRRPQKLFGNSHRTLGGRTQSDVSAYSPRRKAVPGC